ncbi:PilT protein domain protein [Xylanimonas cellulosilytica DSM 15894]|uniref:PilT protein domain protein n=1 Tax=Xylanimonas cellulosilytica (strain DSM 15894 / JCM 12276 / CECT 5975 / KCTC 9989 / LMG 20990 / NBRC 107835 / XIL07) TaxID=446471 RepID=D1BRR2_XYLCX|nr:type II toxin-antitoxin system VapC family toxin [Xylanimonas cellulosilytica]ACZ32328.1 PilT protein domain protein [Xylanimonas cellulosilytica DSM 15894]
MSRSTVLLDTHALFWLVVSPDRIPGPTRDVLGHDDTTILVSAASAWELATKHRIGKMPEAAPLLANWDEDLRSLWAQEIGMNHHDALRAGALEWAHRDPFDRMLAAQAMALTVPLVSGDPVMRTLPGLDLLW